MAALASGHGVPWTILRSPVHRPAGGSLEAEARNVRYSLLGTAARELECAFVATAHTLDDQAETVLLRALRGTGPSGLSGIAPRWGRIVRPMLGLRRDEVRAWLVSNGHGWIDDPTNQDVSYERNWVRHVLMPEIVGRRPGAPAALARLAALSAQDTVALERLVDEAPVFRGADGVVSIDESALAGPDAVVGRVVLRALRDAGARADAATVGRVRRLLDASTGTTADCGLGVHAHRVVSGICLVAGTPSSPEPVDLPVCGRVDAREWGIRVRVGDPDADPWWWRCTLDAGEARSIRIRGRRPGDRVRTSRGTRKVQDVLVDAKIPQFWRGRVPVLETCGRPVAVVGLTTPPASEVRSPLAVDVHPEERTGWIASASPKF